MLGDARSLTNSCRGSSTSTKTITTTKISTMSLICSFRLTLVGLTILGLPVFMVNAIPYGRPHQRTLRLCSKSLSDALYLVCKDHGGYNEPFSYSGEDYARAPSGPGLVEECCYRSCSYEQLETYCKPATDEKRNSQDGIEESLRIVNLPYSSTRELVTERRSGAGIDINEKINKSKPRNCAKLMERDKRRRKHGDHVELGWKGMKIREAKRRRLTRGGRSQRLDNLKKRDDTDGYYVEDSEQRVCRRRRRRWRRRGKILREATIASVPQFKVGTTVPEPKDSIILLFPSRMNLGFQRVSKYFDNSHKFNALEQNQSSQRKQSPSNDN